MDKPTFDISSESRFRALIENSQDIITVIDASGCITYVSPSVTALLGYKPADLIDKSIFDFIHPDDLEATVQSFNLKIAGGSTEGGIGYQCRHHDGSWLRLETVGSNQLENPAVAGIVLNSRDVTFRYELKEKLSMSNALFSTSFNTNMSMATITDLETGQYIDVNDIWLSVNGYTRDQVIGKTASDINVWGSDENRRRFVDAIRKNGNLRQYEGWALTKSGERFDFTLNADIALVNGKECFFISGIDTRQIRKIEERLKQAQKMEAIGQLTGGIAHDFNNILGIVLGNLELLDEKLPEGADYIPLLKAALTGTKRGADLTTKLLNFSRLENSNPQVISANTLITRLNTQNTNSLPSNIEANYILAADLWKIECDPGDLQDSILNISLNACDAMANGGELTIETENIVSQPDPNIDPDSRAPTEYVSISISDTGHGMEQSVQDQIFEPLFTTKGAHHGTGLGLSMVYRFVQRSGGYITVRSELNQGTTVQLFLPRSYREDIEQEDIVSAAAPISQRSETILIVDDNEELLRVATRMLVGSGYKTIIASNADEALDILEKDNSIDLLFSDIMMPGTMNGYGLASIVFEKWPRVKILLTSGFHDENELYVTENKNDLADIADRLLKKPYAKSDLLESIGQLLDETAA